MDVIVVIMDVDVIVGIMDVDVETAAAVIIAVGAVTVAAAAVITSVGAVTAVAAVVTAVAAAMAAVVPKDARPSVKASVPATGKVTGMGSGTTDFLLREQEAPLLLTTDAAVIK